MDARISVICDTKKRAKRDLYAFLNFILSKRCKRGKTALKVMKLEATTIIGRITLNWNWA
jgi:hypothetical protein